MYSCSVSDNVVVAAKPCNGVMKMGWSKGTSCANAITAEAMRHAPIITPMRK